MTDNGSLPNFWDLDKLSPKSSQSQESVATLAGSTFTSILSTTDYTAITSAATIGFHDISITPRSDEAFLKYTSQGL